MRFLHAADLHIDSPLKGLERYEGAPRERIRGATRAAFENLVTLALAERVDFVVLAGDLFDGEWHDMRTGLWTAQQFRRLHEGGVPVYLLRGNHDAVSQLRRGLTWPPNVHEFSTRRPETFVLDSVGAALHGQGFAARETPQDLARDYPEPVAGLFNIGVLHTSLEGSTQHDVYAPTTPQVLVNKGYDYWALGHIHQRQTLRETPFIAYPGNTQGRHVHESGPKGCLVVDVESGRLRAARFHELDAVRWSVLELELETAAGLDAMYAAVERALQDHRQASAGRLAVARVIVRGACAAHQELRFPAALEKARAEIHNLANGLGGDVWVEKIQFATRPPVDLDRLRQGRDLIGDLLRSIEAALSDPAALAELGRSLAPLEEKAARELREAGVALSDPGQLAAWLRRAEGLLVARLWEHTET